MSKRGEFGLIGISGDAISLDRSADRPLYRQLAARLRDAMTRGEIARGSRLPSERDLARELGVSRTTVVGAYRMLRDEGLLAGERGGGTRVVGSGRRGAPMTASSVATTKDVGHACDGVVDLSTSVISGAPPLDPRLCVVTPDALGSRYEPTGLPLLRDRIAARHSAAGLPTEPDEILVTSGAQQAISLIFSVFTRSGGPVLVEAPTYAGALDAARFVGARLCTATAGRGGVGVAAFRAAIAQHEPSLAYLMSSVQNPTGATLDPTRRAAVLRVAADADVPVVDDASLADLAFEQRCIGHGPPAPDLLIGSLNKVFKPGLRVGWIRAATDVIAKLGRAKAVTDLGTAEASQLIAAALLPRIDEVVATRRRQLLDRLELTERLLTTHLPRWSWARPDGGPFLWLRLPGTDAAAFADLAHAHGVRVLPGTSTAPDRGFADHIRLSFGCEPSELSLGIERLAAAWATHGEGRGPDHRPSCRAGVSATVDLAHGT